MWIIKAKERILLWGLIIAKWFFKKCCVVQCALKKQSKISKVLKMGKYNTKYLVLAAKIIHIHGVSSNNTENSVHLKHWCCCLNKERWRKYLGRYFREAPSWMGLNYPEGLTGGIGDILCLVVIEWSLQQHKRPSKKRTLAGAIKLTTRASPPRRDLPQVTRLRFTERQ